MNKEEMPVGFSMALAMNPQAMENFSMLSEDRKQAIIAGTHSISSKDEMHRYVNSIAINKQNRAEI